MYNFKNRIAAFSVQQINKLHSTQNTKGLCVSVDYHHTVCERIFPVTVVYNSLGMNLKNADGNELTDR